MKMIFAPLVIVPIHALVALFLIAPAVPVSARTEMRDIVIYGGTAAAITAAVQAKKMGRSVAIVSPDRHLGGLSSGGLGFTDSGDIRTIGGLAREFYRRIYLHYRDDSAWRWQKRDEFKNVAQDTAAIHHDTQTMWTFEPHVAERVFEDMVCEHGIEVWRDEWLDRKGGVLKAGARMVSFKTLTGITWNAGVFIDATYEGDLMAAAGVDYHVGREAGSVYGEEWNGSQVGILHHKHYFKDKISPYRVPGDPDSGLLPLISSEQPGPRGTGDHRVQAYCFRVCMSIEPTNRLPFPRPTNYDPTRYELLLRLLQANPGEPVGRFDLIPNLKTDTNNRGPVSADYLGMNYRYPEADYEERRRIMAEHRDYQLGLYYFVSHDPRVPASVREYMNRYGLAKDEFVDNGHWPHQLYVREARRMIGTYVMTERDLLKKRIVPDSIGLGSYPMDSHNVMRYVTPEGYVQNEGDVGVGTKGPYAIAYGSIIPRRSQCENLIVPVCISSSHIAYGSIRMEPVFMILGQSAGVVAAFAFEKRVAVHDLPYRVLRERLLSVGQILE